MAVLSHDRYAPMLVATPVPAEGLDGTAMQHEDLDLLDLLAGLQKLVWEGQIVPAATFSPDMTRLSLEAHMSPIAPAHTFSL